jgi:hypothetical protein
MESPFSFEAPSPPHQEVPTTLTEPEVHLDDVIERIENLSLGENSASSQSVEQLGPSHKGPPKWLKKHLKVFILMRSERQDQKFLKTRWK